MKKTLRLFFVAVLAMVSMGVSAQEIIWEEDWSSYTSENPIGINPNYTFTGSVFDTDGVTIKSGTKLYLTGTMSAGGVSPELMIAKNGGSFAAKIAMNGKSGDFTLTYKTNRDDMVLEVTGATLSEKTRAGKDDSYTVTVSGGTEEITLTFKMTSNYNGRLDNIKLIQGEGKKPAGLSWSPSSKTVTIGADDNVFPTLNNTNNLSVTYSSSNEAVATIASDGTITLIAAGKTTINAEFAGNDEYEAGKASYELTVKEAIDDNAEGQKNNPYTVEAALTKINELADGATTSDKFYVAGYVVEISDIANETYKNATFTIADAANGATTVTAFRLKGLGNEDITDVKYLKAGDQVVIYGQLQKYKSGETITPEVKSGYIYKLNGSTTGINDVKVVPADQENAPVFNLAGQKVNANYKGVVIKGGKKMIVK